MIKFGIVLMGGVRSDGVEFYMVFLLLVLSLFYFLGGGVECMLVN